ncbi:MAG: FtsX-like permease family protein [Thermoplasmata archaeon]|nr:FtsX-like permease family protein [Thermoplasmata archaeon]
MVDALTGLRRRPGRTAATAFGIGLATALVVLLLSLASGIQQSSAQLATASGVDLLAASANTSITSASFPPVESAHYLAGAMGRSDPNVATASPWLVTPLIFGNTSLRTAANASPNGAAIPPGWELDGAASIGWIPGRNAGLEVPTVYAGPGFSDPGDPHYAGGTYAGPTTHEVVLDQGLASLLNATVGATVWASPQAAAGPSAVAGWYRNASAFHVVGLSGPYLLFPSSSLGFFYLSELQQLLGPSATRGDHASLVLLHLADPTQAARDQSILTTAFPNLTVFSLGNILGAVEQGVSIYRTFGTLIGLVGVVVATLFTTTVLAISVDERSREIAIRRAIGFRRASVGWLVVQEALVLGALGLAVGLPVGLAGAFAVNGFLVHLVNGLPAGFSFVAVDPLVIGSGIAVVTSIGLVASIGPAFYAMRLPIAGELRAP